MGISPVNVLNQELKMKMGPETDLFNVITAVEKVILLKNVRNLKNQEMLIKELLHVLIAEKKDMLSLNVTNQDRKDKLHAITVELMDIFLENAPSHVKKESQLVTTVELKVTYQENVINQ